MKIEIDQTQLEVDQTDGITWRVTDPQDMFFRPGQTSAGENPDRWFLLEWRDIPDGLILHGPAATEPATWGLLKPLYLGPDSTTP